MFHPSPILERALRRLALTTKQAGKDYYKGTGSGSMGEHTKHGKYIINHAKVRKYVFPDFEKMEACQLTPFVANRVPKERWSNPVDETTGKVKQHRIGPRSGKFYLEKWKTMNGQT